MIGSDRFVSDFHSNLSDPIRTDPNVTTLLFGSDRIRLKTFGSDESDNPIRSVYIPTNQTLPCHVGKCMGRLEGWRGGWLVPTEEVIKLKIIKLLN